MLITIDKDTFLNIPDEIPGQTAIGQYGYEIGLEYQ